MGKNLSPLSLISLVCSLAGIGLYALFLQNPTTGLRVLWIIASIVSVILPILAKTIRVKNQASGKAFEIIALIIAFFDFCIVIMFGTSLPVIIGYAVPIVCIIIYIKVCKEAVISNEDDTKE